MQRNLRRHLFPPSATDAARTFGDDPKGAVVAIINRSDQVFNKWAFILAALTFFTTSYSSFASIVVLPAISFVYWQGPSNRDQNAFCLTTLLSVMFGQVLFGWLADKAGRQKIFGYVFPLTIVSTLGMLQSSQGVTAEGKQTWQFTSWLLFWRFILGTSLGGGYPLSAVLAAEWCPSSSRVRLMGLVSLMQPFGQTLACAVCIAAANGVGSSLVDIDRLWRIVIGVGLLWALIAVLTRLLLPESWRYVWFVAHRPEEALRSQLSGFEEYAEKAEKIDIIEIQDPRYLPVVPSGRSFELGVSSGFTLYNNNRSRHQSIDDDISQSCASTEEDNEAVKQHPSHTWGLKSDQGAIGDLEISRAMSTSRGGNDAQSMEPRANNYEWPHKFGDFVQTPWQASHYEHEEQLEEERSSVAGISNLWTFLTQHNYEYMFRLIGTSGCWFLLSFAYHAMGFTNPAILTKIWAPSDFNLGPDAPWWQSTGGVVNTTLVSGQQVINGLYTTDQTVALGTINESVFDSALRVVLTSSCAALIGILVVVKLATTFNRRRLLFWSFVALATTLVIIAGVIGLAFHNISSALNGPVLLITFWNLAQFCFTCPTTLLFIVTAELFPTRYRCTCYGIAAASGSLGAVVIQVITWTTPSDPDSVRVLQILSGTSAFAMVAAAAIASAPRFLPETQDGKNDVALEKCSDDSRFLPAPVRRLGP